MDAIDRFGEDLVRAAERGHYRLIHARRLAAAARAWARPHRRLAIPVLVVLLVGTPALAAVSGMWTVLDGSHRPAAAPKAAPVSTTTRPTDPALVAILAPLRRAQVPADSSYAAEQAVKLQGESLKRGEGGEVELPGVRFLAHGPAGFEYFLIPIHFAAGSGPAQLGGDFVTIQAVNAQGDMPAPDDPVPPLPKLVNVAAIEGNQAYRARSSIPPTSRGRPQVDPLTTNSRYTLTGLVPDEVARVTLLLPRPGGLASTPLKLSAPATHNVVTFQVAGNASGLTPENYIWYAADGREIKRGGMLK